MHECVKNLDHLQGPGRVAALFRDKVISWAERCGLTMQGSSAYTREPRKSKSPTRRKRALIFWLGTKYKPLA